MANAGKTLRKKLNKRFAGKQNVLAKRAAVMGDGAGNLKVAGSDSFVWVTIGNNNPVPMFNNLVPPEKGIKIWVGQLHEKDRFWQVLSTRSDSPSGVETGFTGYAPAKRYEWHAKGGGQDKLNVHVRALTPLGLFASETPVEGLELYVNLYRGFIYSGTAFIAVPQQDIDLRSYEPTTAGQAVFVLITIDNTGAVIKTVGDEFDYATPTPADVPSIPADTAFCCGAVRVYNGQEKVLEGRNNTDIFDPRFMVSVGGGSGASSAADVSMPKVGTPVLYTLKDDFTTRGASGVIDGTITYVEVDTGDHKVKVAAGEGYIRSTNDQQGDLYFCEWSAVTQIDIPAPAAGFETTRFIGIEYNAGTPQVTTRTSFDWNWYSDFPLARVSYDGTTVRILNAYAHSEDTANLTRKWMRLTHPFTRETAPEGTGGLELSEAATRLLAMSSGKIWHGLNQYTVSAVTSGTAFATHYRKSGGGFNTTSGVTQYPNTQYDDGSGTLQTMTAINKYACLWVYVDIADSSLDVMYGRGEYNSLVSAQAEGIPTTPDHLTYHGRLIGRIIFKKSATSAELIESAWATMFSGGVNPDASSVTYTPTTAADWNSSADPGNVDGALDQLASRAKILEAKDEALLSFVQLPDSKNDVYDSGTSIAKVDSLLVHNANTATETIELFLNNGTNEYRIYKKQLIANETVHLPFEDSFIIDASSKITGNTSTASKVTCMVNGSIQASGYNLAFIQLAATKGDVYDPGTNNAKVTAVLLHNTNTASEVVVLNLHDGTNEYQILKVTVPGSASEGETVIVSLGKKGIPVNSASKITGNTTTASKVTCLVMGTTRA